MAGTPFEEFALVELFGHNRIAGKVTEAEIGGGKFIRVDVPQIGELQPVTRFYSPAAIYGITPLTEETCIGLAASLRAAPMNKWDAQQVLDSHRTLKAPEPEEEYDQSSDNEYDDE